jgi:hypothetical protein
MRDEPSGSCREAPAAVHTRSRAYPEAGPYRLDTDDPNAGREGRGFWSTYSTRAMFHLDDGADQLGEVGPDTQKGGVLIRAEREAGRSHRPLPFR